MISIKPSELKEMVGVHYATKTPLFIYGGFGIGKSAIIRESAKEIAKQKEKEFVEWGKTDKERKHEIMKNPEKYFVLIDIRLSQLEPSDIKGLPKFDGDKDYVEWSIELWLNHLTNPKTDGILFFDEMNLASPSVMASCYQLFHDREIGERKLSDDVFIVGCGNRVEDKAHIYDIPLPLRDRKSEVELIADNDEWFDWALKNNINADILAFLKFRGDYLLKVNEDRANKSITPRGWERTSKLIEHAKGKKQATIRALISGSIGDGIANEFLAFVKLKDNINLDDVMKNPASVKGVEGVDVKYSLIAGLSERFNTDKKTLGKMFEICEYLEAEFGVLLIKLLMGIDSTYVRKNAEKSAVWKGKLSKEYGRYLL